MAGTSATKPRAENLKFELEAWTQIPDSSRFTFMTLGKSLLFFWDSICLLKNGDKKKNLLVPGPMQGSNHMADIRVLANCEVLCTCMPQFLHSYYAEHVIAIIFNSCNKSLWPSILYPPFRLIRALGTERINNLPVVTQLISGGARFIAKSVPTLC